MKLYLLLIMWTEIILTYLPSKASKDGSALWSRQNSGRQRPLNEWEHLFFPMEMTNEKKQLFGFGSRKHHCSTRPFCPRNWQCSCSALCFRKAGTSRSIQHPNQHPQEKGNLGYCLGYRATDTQDYYFYRSCTFSVGCWKSWYPINMAVN